MNDPWLKLSRIVIESNEKFDPDNIELCGKHLCRPSAQNYIAINAFLSNCSRESLKKFLENNALQLMIATLRYMSLKPRSNLSDTVIEVMIVEGIKKILNKSVGMDYILEEDSTLVKDMILGIVF